MTGASSGIGLGLANALAVRGFDLIIIARRRQRLEATATRLAQTTGARVEIIVADLRDSDLLRALETSLARRPVDLLVNCAGFGTYDDFVKIDPERIKDEIFLDLVVPAALSRAALPGMIARKRGAILNIASMAGFIPIPRHAAYCAAKAGLIRLTEALHGELIGSGVRVYAFCPGPVPTEFFGISGYRLEDVPRYLLQSIDDCVAAAMQALDVTSPVKIPHFFVSLFVGVMKRLPLGLRVRVLSGGPAWLNRKPGAAPLKSAA